MELVEKLISNINKYNGVIVNVRLDRVKLSNGGLTLREVVEHPGGVCVIPVDEEGYTYCVEQYRYPMGEILLEAPAGKLEPGEDPVSCALRELSEETGIQAGKIISLGKMYPSPGYCGEVLHLFLARELSMGQAHPDENELLNLHKLHLSQLREIVMDGKITDAKTIVTVLKACACLGV